MIVNKQTLQIMIVGNFHIIKMKQENKKILKNLKKVKECLESDLNQNLSSWGKYEIEKTLKETNLLITQQESLCKWDEINKKKVSL